jgi:outer membrane protein assembly factor BamB
MRLQFLLLVGMGLVVGSMPTPVLSQQRLLVSNQRNNNVNAFDGQSGQYQGIWNDGPGPFYAWGIRQGPDGNVYVSTTGGGSVYRFNSVTGQFIDQFAGGNGILFALDILFMPGGDLLVTSLGTDQVMRFKGTTGEFLGVFASGNGLDAPNGLAYGPDGHLYVASRDNGRVLRFNGTTGAFIDTFVNGLVSPDGMTFTQGGDLLVAVGAGSGSVLRFDGTTGAAEGAFTSGGSLTSPVGVSFGPDGNLYVSNYLPSNVQRFDGTTGAFIDIFATSENLDEAAYFTFISVPEPTTVVLAGLGVTLAVGVWWRRRRSNALTELRELQSDEEEEYLTA